VGNRLLTDRLNKLYKLQKSYEQNGNEKTFAAIDKALAELGQ
jgi:hypothetical protein